MREEFAAVVLAGGAGRRLGGVDKAELELGGVRLLDRALAAVRGADPVVAVGPWHAARSLEDGAELSWVREQPAGGGPVAALVAGVTALPAETELVAVLAVDHPFVTAPTFARLASALEEDPALPGALLFDERERAQWLVGLWRLGRLLEVLPTPAEASGRSVRACLGTLHPARVSARGTEAADVDTPEDLEHLRSLV